MSNILKVTASLILLFQVPSIVYENENTAEYLKPLFLCIVTAFAFFANEHFIFRWIVFVGYAGSIFAEAYYFSEHAFKIYCIAKGACSETTTPLWVHKWLYFRAFFATIAQCFASYLDLYLLVAIGICSDRRELLIRNLDEYGVKRSKGFAIYDITKTNKPYYASLKENIAEDEKAMQEKYIILKEGESHDQSRRGARIQPINSSSQIDDSKKLN